MTDPQDPQRSWLTRRLFPDGTEPDPRFSLANERTFLAWIRTSLALLGGGVALEAFGQEIFPYHLRFWAALALVTTSFIASVFSTWRWYRVERSMRRGQPLPVPTVAFVVALGMLLATAMLVVVVVGMGSGA